MCCHWSGVGTGVTSARAGVIAPIVKDLTERLSLVLLALSVTVKSYSCRGSVSQGIEPNIVLLVAAAAVVELLQLPIVDGSCLV